MQVAVKTEKAISSDERTNVHFDYENRAQKSDAGIKFEAPYLADAPSPAAFPGAGTLGAELAQAAGECPDACFIRWEGRSLSYGSFWQEVRRFAKALLAAGVRPGENVALWAGNRPGWITCYFATAAVGAVLVTVSTRYHAEELAYQLRQCDARLLILEERFLKQPLLERAVEVVPELTRDPFGEVNCPDFPCLRGAVLLEGRGAPNQGQAPAQGSHQTPVQNRTQGAAQTQAQAPAHCAPASCPGVLPLAELLAQGDAVSDAVLDARLAAVRPQDAALMIYTSGTTGAAKGVTLSHDALLNRMRRYCAWNGMTGDDRTYFSLPLFHSFGAVVAVLGALVTRSRLCLGDKFRAQEALATIERERCTVVHGVPSAFVMMLDEDNFASFDLGACRTGVLAGAPASPELVARIMEHIAPAISGCWGLTEATGIVTASSPDDTPEQVASTVGHVVPGSEVIIVDPLTRRPVPTGAQGEVYVRSPYNMIGYYAMEEATREAVDAEGWLHTGDLGSFDANGCLRIDGRIKDMCIVGGVNTYPLEIENHIRKMAGVRDVQVVGVPDEKLGETVCAYVIAEPQANVGELEVKSHCSALASYKVPRHVRFVENFPMTPNGKVQKYLLKEMFLHEA